MAVLKVERTQNSENLSLMGKTILSEDEAKEMLVDSLLMCGIGEDEAIIEMGNDVESAISNRIVSRNANINAMIVDPYISYPDWQKVGFTRVLAGGVLTERNGLWTINADLSDHKKTPHPNKSWAVEAVSNTAFENSTLLCFSRKILRKNAFKKMITQFNRVFIGYYGLADSEELETYKSSIERMLTGVESNFTEEEVIRKFRDSKFITHLMIKK